MDISYPLERRLLATLGQPLFLGETPDRDTKIDPIQDHLAR